MRSTNLPLTNPSKPLTLGQPHKLSRPEGVQTKASVYTFSGFVHAVTVEGDVKQPLCQASFSPLLCSRRAWETHHADF